MAKIPTGRSQQAAAAAAQRNTMHLDLPLVGQVTLPPPERLAFYAGVGLLAALEIVEWPVAIVLAVGHVLADNRRSMVLRDFGEALEEA